MGDLGALQHCLQPEEDKLTLASCLPALGYVGPYDKLVKTDRGVLLWELAEKCSDDFGTRDTTGPSKANVAALAAAIAGRDQILASTCSGLADQGIFRRRRR